MRLTLLAAAIAAAATGPPHAHAIEIPTEAATERPFFMPEAETNMSAENYPALFERVLVHEGGYSNDRDDPGNWTGGKVGSGELLGTKYGIAANTFPNEDIKNLTKERARELYRSLYWGKVKGDQLPAGVDWAVLDYAINSGPFRAAVSLQRALKVADDGAIGPLTLKALGTANPAKIINAICDERLAFMKKLAHWPKYKNGWTRRVAETRAAALSMTAAQPSLLVRATSLLKRAA